MRFAGDRDAGCSRRWMVVTVDVLAQSHIACCEDWRDHPSTLVQRDRIT